MVAFDFDDYLLHFQCFDREKVNASALRCLAEREGKKIIQCLFYYIVIYIC
jgi:hypothetical protein